MRARPGPSFRRWPTTLSCSWSAWVSQLEVAVETAVQVEEEIADEEPRIQAVGRGSSYWQTEVQSITEERRRGAIDP